MIYRYRIIFGTRMNKGIRLNIRWMPSHVKVDEDRPVDVTVDDVHGNAIVDELAKQAAKEAELPLNVSATMLYYKWLTKQIQQAGYYNHQLTP